MDALRACGNYYCEKIGTVLYTNLEACEVFRIQIGFSFDKFFSFIYLLQIDNKYFIHKNVNPQYVTVTLRLQIN